MEALVFADLGVQPAGPCMLKRRLVIGSQMVSRSSRPLIFEQGPSVLVCEDLFTILEI